MHVELEFVTNRHEKLSELVDGVGIANLCLLRLLLPFE